MTRKKIYCVEHLSNIDVDEIIEIAKLKKVGKYHSDVQ